MTHDEMLDVIAAHKAGAKIETRRIGDTLWYETRPIWDFPEHEYRIKPREPREGYICVEVGVNKFFPSREHAQTFADSHKGKYRVAKVREVIE